MSRNSDGVPIKAEVAIKVRDLKVIKVDIEEVTVVATVTAVVMVTEVVTVEVEVTVEVTVEVIKGK
jgi:hypothetical protein